MWSGNEPNSYSGLNGEKSGVRIVIEPSDFFHHPCLVTFRRLRQPLRLLRQKHRQDPLRLPPPDLLDRLDWSTFPQEWSIRRHYSLGSQARSDRRACSSFRHLEPRRFR